MSNQYVDKYGKEYPDGPRARRYENRCLPLDTHELLKEQILKQGLGSVDSGGNSRSSYNDPAAQAPNDKNSVMIREDTEVIKDQTGVSDKYFKFYSGEATGSNRAASEFTFSIVDRNLGFPIQNIISVEIRDFYFPTITSATIYPDPYFYQRITMVFRDFPATQSIRSVNNSYHHFEFNVSNAGIVQYLIPVNDMFIFTQPIRDLSQITIQFRYPETILALPEEFILLTPIPGTSPAQFTLPANNPLAASTTYAVWFINYVSSDVTTTASLLNREGGHMGTTNAGNTTITLSDPATAIGAAEINNATIQIGQNSFGFTLRFRTIQDKLTNFITPV